MRSPPDTTEGNHVLYEITYANGDQEEVEADWFDVTDGIYIFKRQVDPRGTFKPVLAIPSLGGATDSSRDIVSVEAITYEDEA